MILLFVQSRVEALIICSLRRFSVVLCRTVFSCVEMSRHLLKCVCLLYYSLYCH